MYSRTKLQRLLFVLVLIFASYLAGQHSQPQAARASLPTVADITLETNQASAFGGSTVGFAGDVNGDGFLDVFQGANDYDNGQADEGAVFVYYGAADGLSRTENWSAESDQASSLFGYTAAFAGDVNGDGYDDVVIGGQGLSVYDKGITYVFLGSASGLNSQPHVTIQGEAWGDKFGWAVATAGDVNGDGYDDVIVGAIGYGSNSEGKVYVFHGSSSGISGSASWTKAGTAYGGELGFSVGYAGDINHDGYGDIIIGEPKTDTATLFQAGKAYVYPGASNGLSSSPYWVMEGNNASASFGFKVGSAGSILNETIFRIIVAEPGYDNGQTNEGGAFIYYSRCD